MLTLRSALTAKNEELKAKTEEANQKLNAMLVDQRAAEQKREASLKIADEVKQQEGDILKRKAQVDAELKDVQPALEKVCFLAP